MLLVAALAARVATSPAVAITAPNACGWSAWFPAQRYSITNFQGFNVAGFVQTPPEAGQSRGVTLRATRGSNRAIELAPANQLDHLVGTGDQGGRYGDAKSLSGLEIYDQLDFGVLLDRKIGWLLALENPPGISANQVPRFRRFPP
jgi:hypothetical protein